MCASFRKPRSYEAFRANIGDRIKTFRKACHMTQAELGDFLGLGKSTISEWENGKRSPDVDLLPDIAAALHVSARDLIPNDIPVARNVRTITRRRVPVLGHIAAGEPIYLDDSAEMFALADSDIQCDFAMIVEGDSMEPRILSGDAVFVRAQDAVGDGEIAAVQIVDDFGECYATLKHVYYTTDGVQLVSENHRYKPMVFTQGKCENVRILGKAVAYQRML